MRLTLTILGDLVALNLQDGELLWRVHILDSGEVISKLPANQYVKGFGKAGGVFFAGCKLYVGWTRVQYTDQGEGGPSIPELCGITCLRLPRFR